MPLGYNRRYNTLRGLPVSHSQLNSLGGSSGTNLTQVGVAGLFGDDKRLCVIETLPKTGAGLPTGSDAEQYVVDFSQCVWRLRAYGNGAAITAGDELSHIVADIGSGYTGSAISRVGTLMNASTAITGITVDSAGRGKFVVLEVVGGTSISSGNGGDVDVMLVPA